MIQAQFLRHNGILCGFILSGHSNYADIGSDIVCAAVSSAALMAANTITEILGCAADIKRDDQKGYLSLTVTEDMAKAGPILKGFRLHLFEIAKKYPMYCQKIITVNDHTPR